MESRASRRDAAQTPPRHSRMEEGDEGTPLKRSPNRQFQSTPLLGKLREERELDEKRVGYGGVSINTGYSSNATGMKKSTSFLGNLDAKWKVWRSSRKQPRSIRQRIMNRDSYFFQSMGKWNIERSANVDGVQQLYDNDRFHTLLNMATWKVLLLLFGLYIFIVTSFAFTYLLIALLDGCNMGIVDIREAYYFSLETMTTVGYGTPDIYFGRCWSVMIVITMQACCGLLIDACLIGLLFARLSRPQTRASTVVFSNHAVLRRIRGEYYLMFQVGELRKHQLLEAHVRCYAIRHHRSLPTPEVSEICDVPLETTPFQTHSMRLQHPDDELGSNLLLVLPQIVVHRIDAWSPLMPPPRWMSSHGLVQWGIHEDCDWIKAPWETPTHAQTHAHASTEGHENNNLHENIKDPTRDMIDVTRVLEHESDDKDKDEEEGGNVTPDAHAAAATDATSKMLRRQTFYWDTVHADPRDGDEKGPGYVYRFPDLLKRWDDVDGDRNTWYERMKHRCTVMEQLRLERVQRARAEGIRFTREQDPNNNSNTTMHAPGTAGGGASAESILLASKAVRRKRAASILHVYRDSDDEMTGNNFGGEVHAGGSGMTVSDSGVFRRQTSCSSPISDTSTATSYTPNHGQYFQQLGAGGGHASNIHQHQHAHPMDPIDAKLWFAREERKAINVFLKDCELEVVVIVEGIDTSTGSTVQCRSSYTLENMVWDHGIAPCVFKDPEGKCVVDFAKFHDIIPAPSDCVEPGFVQSYA